MQNKETTLLDSSLNTGQFFKLPILNTYKNYNIKVLDCKGYKQLYIYEKDKFKKLDCIENDLSSKKHKPKEDNTIEFKNVIRSKIKLQRLAKCNEEHWKTFITLTFKDNITDLSKAYKLFRNFIKSINRVYKDFKWLCVPEFQKSGRVHYHLITNIELDNSHIIQTQEYNGNIYYHIKQWKNGFDCVELVKDKDGNDTKKLCGYIAKYMSKAYIEDCFFNKNRYYCSQNLIQPITYYIDLKNEKDINTLSDILSNTDLIYKNDYLDNYSNSTISFLEYKK